MSQASKWESGAAPSPIYRDGLTSNLTYAIVATKKQSDTYEVVCVRGYALQDQYKVKFYPNLEAWSLTLPQLLDMGFGAGLNRVHGAGYYRVVGNAMAMKSLFKYLSSTRNVATVTYEQFKEGINKAPDKALSAEVHPYRGGNLPTSPRAVVAPVMAPVAVPNVALDKPLPGSRKKPLKD